MGVSVGRCRQGLNWGVWTGKGKARQQTSAALLRTVAVKEEHREGG